MLYIFRYSLRVQNFIKICQKWRNGLIWKPLKRPKQGYNWTFLREQLKVPRIPIKSREYTFFPSQKVYKRYKWKCCYYYCSWLQGKAPFNLQATEDESVSMSHDRFQRKPVCIFSISIISDINFSGSLLFSVLLRPWSLPSIQIREPDRQWPDRVVIYMKMRISSTNRWNSWEVTKIKLPLFQ